MWPDDCTWCIVADAELDFRKNPQILSSIVDAMVDGLFTCDADGNVVSWSDGAARMTGYAPDEVVGKPCRVLEGPNGRGFSTVHDLLAQGEPPEGICRQECKFRTKDGRELDLLGKVRVLTDEAGRVRGAVGTFTHQTSSMLANERIALRTEPPQGQHAFGGLVGRSAPMQEREVRRVGDTQATKVDVRLVTATNRGLESLRAAGTFREDFYYRIRVYEIALPPLRDRREDVPLLVEHFIAEFGPTHKKNVSGITDEALQCLLDYPWPGNVRELRNAIECAFVTVSGDESTLLDMPPDR